MYPVGQRGVVQSKTGSTAECAVISYPNGTITMAVRIFGDFEYDPRHHDPAGCVIYVPKEWFKPAYSLDEIAAKKHTRYCGTEYQAYLQKMKDALMGTSPTPAKSNATTLKKEQWMGGVLRPWREGVGVKFIKLNGLNPSLQQRFIKSLEPATYGALAYAVLELLWRSL